MNIGSTACFQGKAYKLVTIQRSVILELFLFSSSLLLL
jgi:hypothetical protein